MTDHKSPYIIPIIIVNWNGLNDTLECINSVINSTIDNWHIYLIDNNSDNSEGLRLQTEFQGHKQITVKLFPENLGFAKAHNRIWEDTIEHLKTPYLVLLNNDTSVEANWLQALDNCYNQKNVSIIACKMINYYNRGMMDNAGHRMLNTGEIIPIGHNQPVESYGISDDSIGACGGACLYSTDLIKKIGFFDPHFSTGYEDAEFGLRAMVTGHSSVYCPDSIVYHKMGQSIKKVFNEEYSLMIHSSILFSYFKCMPTTNILIALPSFIFKYCSMLIIDIIFMRYKYLRILIKSWRNLILNKGHWIQKRRKLSAMRKWHFSHPKLIFFLWFDILRFWNLIILRKDSNIDSYGN